MRNTLSYQQSTYENDKIKSAQMAVDTSLNERVLDVDTMSATISVKINDPLYFFTAEPLPFFTRDGLRFMTAAQRVAFSPDVVQNTPVRFLRGGSQYALWYLARITRVAPDLYTLSMTSSLGRLTQMPHKGGIYNGVAASTIIADICGVVPHFVGAAFQNVLLYGWLPYVAPSGENGAQTGSAKDNLLKVLFALNATVRDDADGTLRIENLSTAVSAQLGADRIYRDNASVVTEPTVTAVTVLEHQYITGSEPTTLFEGTTVDGQVIVFREPMSNLTATGFTVTESNANYAVVSAGSGTLTGTPYIHTTREITKPVTAAAIPNAVRIEDATLVGVTNSSDVVNRLVDYYSHRTYINVDATIDFEDAGDVVEIYDPFDKLMRQACIEKISPLVVSQTMKGRVSALVGFTPWQVVPFEDVRELITEDVTWTVPDDVPAGTEVQVVLFGGGQGGSPGEAGKAAPQPTVSDNIITNPPSGPNYYDRGTFSGNPIAGKGGVSGKAGNGGNIYRFTVIVNPGDSFAVSIGIGGRGAAFGSDSEGDIGTATTFGNYSSDSGGALEYGFQDPITGDVYGAKGSAGVSGGDGASYDVPNPAPVTVDGQSWIAGRPGIEARGSRGSYNTGAGYFAYISHGSYGGGAAYGANGSDGANGSGFVSSSSATAYSMRGGNGGNALPFPKETIPGKGGRGGNGGGGRGCYGRAMATNNYASPATGGTITCTVQSALPGGNGSDGGDGADGGVLILYRRPVTE